MQSQPVKSRWTSFLSTLRINFFVNLGHLTTWRASMRAAVRCHLHRFLGASNTAREGVLPLLFGFWFLGRPVNGRRLGTDVFFSYVYQTSGVCWVRPGRRGLAFSNEVALVDGVSRLVLEKRTRGGREGRGDALSNGRLGGPTPLTLFLRCPPSLLLIRARTATTSELGWV